MGEQNGLLTELPAKLEAFLQGPRLVLVTTLDSETKWPTNNLITWVLAYDQKQMRLAADAKGRILQNIRADDRVLLSVLAYGACYVAEGHGKVLADELPGVTLKLGCAGVEITAVRDVTFWGGRITAEPEYDVNYDHATKEKLDTAVFKAMREL